MKKPFSYLAIATLTFLSIKVSGQQPLNSTDKLAIGLPSTSRALLETGGNESSVPSAIFGSDAWGLSITDDYPMLGFNSWWDGSAFKSISGTNGFGAAFSFDPYAEGSFTFRSTNGRTAGANATQTMVSRLVITNTGRVGIGTNTPDVMLTVNGNASKPGGGGWATFSDMRLKKDVSAFTDGLAILKKFNPVKFKYNGLAGYQADGKEYVGVIAQNVKTVAPYMISTERKKLNTTDATETELLMYDGSALTYVLVNAVKEQQQMIEEQKKQIEKLEMRLNALAMEVEKRNSISVATAKK